MKRKGLTSQAFSQKIYMLKETGNDSRVNMNLRLSRAEVKFDAVTAATDNMQSKLLKVFDSVTAAKDNMKSKLPGAHNNSAGV